MDYQALAYDMQGFLLSASLLPMGWWPVPVPSDRDEELACIKAAVWSWPAGFIPSKLFSVVLAFPPQPFLIPFILFILSGLFSMFSSLRLTFLPRLPATKNRESGDTTRFLLAQNEGGCMMRA